MREIVASNMNYNIAYCFYLPAMLFYSLSTVHDIGSCWLLFLTLLSFTSVFRPSRHKKLHIVIAVSTVLDLILKVLVMLEVFSFSLVDLNVIDNMVNIGSRVIEARSLVYLLVLILSWVLVFTYNVKSKTRVQTQEQLTLLEFLSNTLDYITPILLYTLCFTKLTNDGSFRSWLQHINPEQKLQLGSIQMFQQVFWSILTTLFLISNKQNSKMRKILTIMSIVLIIRDNYMQFMNNSIQYHLEWKIIVVVKAVLLGCWRIHNKYLIYYQLPDIDEDSFDRSAESRVSSHMRFVYKRKRNSLQSINHIIVVCMLLVTIFTVVITNGLGNVFIILGIGINFPNYIQSKFRRFIALGALLSLMLQPQQFIYFIFLYVLKLFTTEDQQYDKKNWWVAIQLGRIIVMLSKVSLLTFLIGLFQSSWLVLFTLIFRTFCSYFGEIIVFMGTEDTYAYFFKDIFPKSMWIDTLLWLYYIFLRIYSHATSAKFHSTDITNIFEQYSLIQYIEKILKVLKIFHWIAYISISFFIVNSTPCLFTILRIVPLVAVFIFGILQSHKSTVAYYLWGWNFYTALGIAFVKYFYLLSRYENLSSWLVNILQPLIEHHQFIGLTPPDGTSLLVVFGPDFLLILVNAIMMFIIKVSISEMTYEEARKRIGQQQGLNTLLLEKEEETKNIHYLYKKYIKPLSTTFRQDSLLRIVLTDYIMDTCFFCFMVIIQLFGDEVSKYYYIPHFGLFLYGFIFQRGKHYPKHLFNWLVFVCSLDLLLIYCRYFFSLISSGDVGYDVNTVISKYGLVLISVIFKQASLGLEDYYLNVAQTKPQHSFLLFKILAPVIEDQTFRKEVIVLYLHWNKIFAFSCYIAQMLAGPPQVIKIHSVFLVLLLISTLCCCGMRQQIYKRTWMYFLVTAVFIDLWLGYFTSIFCLIGLRGYYTFLQEFDLQLFVEKYDRSNKTDNQETSRKVEIEEVRMKEVFNFPSKDRLPIIDQVREQNELSVSSKLLGVNWEYKNTYLTIVWLLPLFFMFLTILGALFFNLGRYGFTIIATNIIAIVIVLKKLFQFTVAMKIVKRLMTINFFMVKIAIVDEVIFGVGKSQLLQYYGVGIFMMILGSLGYLQMTRNNGNTQLNLDANFSYHIDFCQRRAREAIQYWKLKCEMVSELGSQIHNEKKMTSLKKFFLHRQYLAIKVQQLENQLKLRSSHRKTHFRRLQKMQNDDEIELKKMDFEVYSNMLTFMSIEDLQFCYLDLNKYYSSDGKEYKSSRQVKSQREQSDVAEGIKNMKEWILLEFQSSIKQTIQKYRKRLEPAAISLDFIKLFPVLEESKKSEEKREENPLMKKQTSLERQMERHSSSSSSYEMIPIDTQSYIPEKEHSQKQSNFKLKKRQSFSRMLQLCSSKIVPLSSKSSSEKEQFMSKINQRLNEHSWILRKIIQNIEIIGLIVTAGWNFFGGVYTIPTNIAIFAWAIILQSKTTVSFWLFQIGYCSVIMTCKLLLPSLPKHLFIDFLFYYHADDYLYQFIIIFVSAMEIVFLRLGGTAQIDYSQRQHIYDAFYRNVLNNAAKGKKVEGQAKFLQVYKKMRNSDKHSFLYRVFSKGKVKPGKDFYPLLAFVQVLILFYIFFFYDMMEFESQNNRKSLGEILTVTKFSKNMIMALFFQVMIMVIDRIVVALNMIDRLNEKLQNFLFCYVFKYYSKYSQIEIEELQNINKLDFLLIIKYMVHVILLLLINFFAYLYIPSGGLSKNLIPECEMAVCGKSYNYLSFFLLLYLVYFVISGLQIKHGFNRNKCRNRLMENYHWIDYYTYLFFTGIPFLWEFKKIADWTTTATALPLFHWMKFEDINARMFRSKCEAQILRAKKLGKGSWYKCILGPLGFLFIIGFVFSPIIMYSSFNPFAVRDQIISASSQLTIVMNGKNRYNFFSTSHTSIRGDENVEKKYKLLGFFERADLYQLQTSSYPDTDFSLSEPALNKLSNKLYRAGMNESRDYFEIHLLMNVSEKIGGESQILWGSKLLSSQQLLDICATMKNEQQMFQINQFYSPFPGQISNQTIYVRNRNQGQYFQVSTTKMNKNYLQIDSLNGSLIQGKNKTKMKNKANETVEEKPMKGLFIFYKSSVKYRVAFGLVTFYLTYVVLLNSLFRVYLTGNLQAIIYQGPQLQKILFLCEAVRSARILQNFYQQEYMYFSLIDLMRHPHMIREIADDFNNMKRQHEKQQ